MPCTAKACFSLILLQIVVLHFVTWTICLKPLSMLHMSHNTAICNTMCLALIPAFLLSAWHVLCINSSELNGSVILLKMISAVVFPSVSPVYACLSVTAHLAVHLLMLTLNMAPRDVATALSSATKA